MSSEIAIKCDGLGKAYAIYRKPEDRLKQMVASFLRTKSVYYSTYWALDGVSVEVRRGESLGIIGRNGSGKSTLLQLLCGTLTPTIGSLSVKGRVAALLELGAGFNPEFTGRENVFLSAAILGLSQEQIEERLESIEAFAGIGDFINQPVKLYSSGMYARLAFSVAAHVDADVLIIDEILAVGDASFTQKCMRFIREFKERGTLLFVSHDSASVIDLCDRALWLEGGKQRALGESRDVCHDYLAAILAEKEDPARFKIGGARLGIPISDKVVQDPRRGLLEQSTLRNEIHVYDFNPDAKWFGDRRGVIESVAVTDEHGNSLQLLNGGEIVEVRIKARAIETIAGPILGFYLKDKRGQQLFGENTYLVTRAATQSVVGGQEFSARFRFQLPFLPPGDYAITAALASGTQSEHAQHHWLEDAMFFHVPSSHIHRGLVGIPMIEIELKVSDTERENSFAAGVTT